MKWWFWPCILCLIISIVNFFWIICFLFFWHFKWCKATWTVLKLNGKDLTQILLEGAKHIACFIMKWRVIKKFIFALAPYWDVKFGKPVVYNEGWVGFLLGKLEVRSWCLFSTCPNVFRYCRLTYNWVSRQYF